ncbi:MAG: 3-deoxy-7-phosphoheptulonate synthase [Planctomycetes bacterium]|nr:3-deoxy-7-phosphoheptulonate synthase [Planctomycetota bacterium]
MIVLVRRGADPAAVQATLQGLGLWTVLERGQGAVALRALPASARVDAGRVREVDGVEDVLEPASAHPRVDAQAGLGLALGDLRLGPGAGPVLMAGPCAVESAAQAREAAALVADAGGRVLRGGAYKPRTSPYAFQGVGAAGLDWLRAAADAEGLAVVTEVLSEADAPAVANVADLVQVGARNMQNFALLRAVGATGAAVLLKRGPAATLEEWLLAAEHLLAAGARGVAFCERGVRGFDPATRHALDLSGVALLAAQGQPVVVDPSHAAGRRDLVAPLARAALAAGAHGLLVEVHPDPATARSDGPQALDPAAWRALAASLALPAPVRA